MQTFLQIGEIKIKVTRKRIKNLHLRIDNFTGEVRVSSPMRISDVYIKEFALSHIDWIRKQRIKVLNQPKEPRHFYVQGEFIYYLGEKFPLEVSENGYSPKVFLGENVIFLFIKPGTSIHKRHLLMEQFYRDQLKVLVPGIIAKWELLLEVSVCHFGIKKMKTKWGTCNIRAKRIWLNLELIKKSPLCLEYIIVHEMVHLIERKHNKHFYNILHHHFPQWKSIKEELNQRFFIP